MLPVESHDIRELLTILRPLNEHLVHYWFKRQSRALQLCTQAMLFFFLLLVLSKNHFSACVLRIMFSYNLQHRFENVLCDQICAKGPRD